MAGCGWTKSLARAALLMVAAAGTAGFAQSAGSGSLTGKLTDLRSRPLAGATVWLRNQATGVEAHIITTKSGAYHFTGLSAGDYILETESPGLGRGRVDGIVVSEGHESRVQAAVALAPAPLVTATKAPEMPGRPLIRPASETLAVDPAAPPTPARLFRQAADREMLETDASPVNEALTQEPMRSLAMAAHSIEMHTQQTPVSAAAMAAAGTQIPADMTAHPAAGLTPEVAAIAVSRAGCTQVRPSPHGFASVQAAVEVAVQAARAVIQASLTAQQSAFALTHNGGPGSSAAVDTVTAEQVQALPLTGRDWQNFVLDAPVTGAHTQADSPTVRSRDMQALTVDGADIRLAFGGSGMGRMNGRKASLIGPGASEATIREVQTAEGYASGERASVSRANVETQRGTNALHGQASLFTRQNFWGAQNPFTQWVTETAPATLSAVPVFTPASYTPSDRETIWEFGLGGQTRRDKLFWFAALDSFERNDPGVSTVKHPDNFFAQPSNDQMQVLSARLGLSSANPVAAGVAAYSTMLETLDSLLGPAPRASTQWTGFGRLDWAAAERHRFTLEGTGAQLDAPGGGLTGTSETYGNHSYGSSRAGEQWLLGRWEAFVTPNLLAVTQGSVGRSGMKSPPENPSAYEQSLNINDWGQLPQIVVDSRYGFTIGNPSRFGTGSYPDEHLYQAKEQLNWVHGQMLVKAGVDLNHNRDATSELRNQTGTYYYSSVENFASDALAFAKFGLNGQLNELDQHNCDQTGKVWRDSAGTLHGLGYLPCYNYYSQTMGPTNWWLSTNDLAGYVTAQWDLKKQLTLSLAMRWERELLPPPISRLNNPDLPLTQKLPDPGNEWGPRVSIAWGSAKSRWPVLRLGYGMYFERTANATLENALTQTGSVKGDLNLFMRPTDNLSAGGAPPFPYVLAGEPATAVKPGAVEFAPSFRNGEVHQAVVSVEQTLPGRVRIEASAAASLGRRLPVTIDANIDPAVNPQTITYAVVDGNNSGPIAARQITVPFYASWPSSASTSGFAGRLNTNYQQVAEILAKANSTYEAATLQLARSSRGGLTVRARYTYAHAMDWNPNESAQITGPTVFDPTDTREEYGASNLDIRHSSSTSLIWGPKLNLHDWAGRLANGWMMSGVGSFQSGMPYTMRTSGSLAREFDTTGAAIVGLAPGMNGYGGDSRVYGVGRNTYRYPSTWKADMRLGREFKLGEMRQLELLAESFNLFNHQNVTELETTGYFIESGSVNGSLPTLNFLTGLKTGQTEFGQPLNVNATNFYRQRQFQFGLRMRF
jgi:hypothetical protein